MAEEKEEEKNEDEDEEKVMIMTLFSPVFTGNFTDYKIWLDFASMIKFRPSIVFCVFVYCFFHSGFDI
jgi:hypothetical protein